MKQPSKDIAIILSRKDPDKYKDIIARASVNGYHDHKFMNIPGHPEYGQCICPKVQLAEDLSKFPELTELRVRVINGDFDDPADATDQQEMRAWLIQDESPDELFKQLDLKVPTAAERQLGRAINN